MKRSLFIFQLFCLLISNFNYSTEDLTKKATESLTKQLLVAGGSILTTYVAMTNKDQIFEWGKTFLNLCLHKRTQSKVDETNAILSKDVKPAIQKIDHELIAINNRTTRTDTSTKEIKKSTRIIKKQVASSNNKIDELLAKNDALIQNHLNPMQKNIEESLMINKRLDERTENMHSDLKQVLRILQNNNQNHQA